MKFYLNFGGLGREVARLDAEICLKDGLFGIWKLSDLRV
jgi:hypothetical protein